MSDWATTIKGGDAISAWEYRANFLRDAVRIEIFYCPFCDIPLVGCLINVDSEIKKSPYFSARWGDHLPGCNGSPILVHPQNRRAPRTRIQSRVMHFPEVLTNRPLPRERVESVPDQHQNMPSENEILSRRRKCGANGQATPRTCLLRPIVEAQILVVKDGFRQVREKKFEEKDRKVWTREVLESMPLKLNEPTNYQDAFRTSKFANTSKAHIYLGRGQVKEAGGIFLIEDINQPRSDSNSAPFSLLIDPLLAGSTSPLYHHALVQQLNGYLNRSESCRWYAFGQPQIGPHGYQLVVRNLDFVYLKVDSGGKGIQNDLPAGEEIPSVIKRVQDA